MAAFSKKGSMSSAICLLQRITRLMGIAALNAILQSGFFDGPHALRGTPGQDALRPWR